MNTCRRCTLFFGALGPQHPLVAHSPPSRYPADSRGRHGAVSRLCSQCTATYEGRRVVSCRLLPRVAWGVANKVIATIMIERFADGIIVLMALTVGTTFALRLNTSVTVVQSLLGVGILVFVTVRAATFCRVVPMPAELVRRLWRFAFLTKRFEALSESLRSVRSPCTITVFLISIAV
jgi:hypothetical protein